jgi:glucose 1-dehydrogenase
MGMGEATARVFAAAGAHVLVSDINPESGEATAESIQRDGGSASFCRTDVSSAADAEAMVRTAVERYGRLDCAVNSAAVTPDTHPIVELDEQEWDRVLAVDLKGVALCLKYEVAQMLEQGGGGAIVNIASTAGVRAGLGPHVYTAAKQGVIGLTQSVAPELGRHGIRVNAIAPGAIPGGGFNAPPGMVEKIPLRRFGTPADVAGMAIAVLSERFGAYVTGATVVVDGGIALHNWIEPPR